MDVARWEHIKELFHTALEQPAAERAVFLATACGADAELRREVELLLAAQEEASGFLEAPALQRAAQRLVADEQPTQQFGAAIGQQFSHYKILSHIGAGGMGEVYLARDAHLKRRVALKVLPLKFTQDAERLQRFIREAEAASALNHPNIITIYEIGMVESARGQTHFIATEYIEGVTLRAWRSEDEGKRLSQTLEFGSQIASALDAAHHAGIVHRDIKPENLMVRPDGLVKVLDFGLAKLTATNTSGSNQIDTDAQTTPPEMETLPGLILGTLRYMSPEQARGQTLDARTDIFSLGVVLYELLTGKPLFEGETTADVIAAIIHREMPPLSSCFPDAPPELERILRKALAKDCRDRYQTARDLQIDLQVLKQESELSERLARSGQLRGQATDSSAAAALVIASSFLSKQLLWVLPLILLVGGALWWGLVERNRAVKAPPPHMLKPMEIFTWQSALGEVALFGSLSPNGDLTAYTSFKSGVSSIWINLAATEGTEQSTKDDFPNRNPIWSPNGKEIAYISLRSDQPGIWRKPPLGGTATLLKSLAKNEFSIQLRAWLHDGATIYYEMNRNLYALDVASKTTKQLTNFGAAQVFPNTISISRDERHLAYSGKSGQETFVWTMPVGGGEPQQIARTTAPASKTVWHPDNQRVFFSAGIDRTSQIFVADHAGHQVVQLTFGDQDLRVLDVSADGTKVLYGSTREESDVWGVKTPKAEEFLVSSEIGFECWPDISSDGRNVAYQYVRNFNQTSNSDQSAILSRTLVSNLKPIMLVKEGFWPKWSPDGNWLAFLRGSVRERSLWVIKVGSGEEKKLTSDAVSGFGSTALPFNRMVTNCFDWSPDSNKLVYGLEQGESEELWVVTADGASNTQVTNHGTSGRRATSPVWSPEGKHIAYLTANSGEVWITEVEAKASKVLLHENSSLRLLGWARQAQELVLAKRPLGLGNKPTSEVNLFRLSVVTGKQHALATLPNVYFENIHLSPDRKYIAFVARQAEKDNVWVLSLNGGIPQPLTKNNDPWLYLSNLAWSPDSRALYFGKQTKHNVIAMLTKFE